MENVLVDMRLRVLFVYLWMQILLCSLFAQKATGYLGLEAIITSDKYEYADLYESSSYEGAGLEIKPAPSFALGLFWGKKFSTNTCLETGIIFKQYTTAFVLSDNSDRTNRKVVKLNTLFRVPLRLKYLLAIIPERLYFSPSLGVSIAFNGNDVGKFYSSEGVLHAQDGASYDYFYKVNFLQNSLIKPFWLVEPAIGLTAPLGRWHISLQVSAVKGLRPMHTGVFSYNSDINNIDQRIGALAGTGDFFCGSVGITFDVRK